MEVVLIIIAVGIASAVIGCIAFLVDNHDDDYLEWFKEHKKKGGR